MWCWWATTSPWAQTLDPVIEAAAKAGVGVVAMKVMAGGFRRAKPGAAALRHAEEGWRHGGGAQVGAAQSTTSARPFPSITDVDQLDDNLKAMAARVHRGRPRNCWRNSWSTSRRSIAACAASATASVRKGVPVADVLRFLTYAEGYGQFALARERYLELPAEVAQVRCNLCPTCTVSCPHGVRVTRAADPRAGTAGMRLAGPGRCCWRAAAWACASARLQAGAGLAAAGRRPQLHRRKPVRVHGRQRRRLPDLRLHPHGRRHLRQGR